MDDSLVREEIVRILLHREKPVASTEQSFLVDLGDGEIPTDREIDDRRGDVERVGALVHQKTDLRRTELRRRLVLGDDRLVRAVVAATRVPAAVEREESPAGDDGREREPRRREIEELPD